MSSSASIVSSSSQNLSSEFNPFSPNYSVIYKFEQRFDYIGPRKWMEDNWHTSFYWAALYMVVVFGGQAWMSNRSAYKLRLLLVIWNVFLASFSIIGTLRTFPEMVHVLRTFGFSHSVSQSIFKFLLIYQLT